MAAWIGQLKNKLSYYSIKYLNSIPFSERVIQGKYKMGLSVVWAQINVALILSQLEVTVRAQWPMVRCLSSDKMLKTLPGFIDHKQWLIIIVKFGFSEHSFFLSIEYYASASLNH